MHLPKISPLLGDYFVHHTEDGRHIPNYFVKNVEKSARYAVALARHGLVMGEKVRS